MATQFDFDELAKDLARGLSRRKALQTLGSGFLGGLLVSLGLGEKVRAQAGTSTLCRDLCKQTCTTTDSSSKTTFDFNCFRNCILECSNCNSRTCQVCDIERGTCGLSCNDPCTTNVLSLQASQDTGFRQLIAYLSAQGFVQTQASEVVIIQQDETLVSSALGALYTHTNRPNETALLVYGIAATGVSEVYAIVYENEVRSYLLVISDSGQVEQLIPDSQSISDNSVSVDFHLTSFKVAQSSPLPGLSCNTKCNFVCGWALGFFVCRIATAAVCVGSGPAAPLCAWVLSATCRATSLALCLAICNEGICREPSRFCPCPTKNICYDTANQCAVECPSGLACFGFQCRPPQPGEC